MMATSWATRSKPRSGKSKAWASAHAPPSLAQKSGLRRPRTTLGRMELWKSVRSWLGREAEEAKDLAEDLETKWASDLERKEAELEAQPEERMRSLQDRIAESSSAFEEIKAKITRTGPVTDDDGNPIG